MKIEQWNIADITSYGKNPRVNDQAVDAVVASIREFGFRQPVVVDTDGVIVVGDTRYPPYNVKVEPRSNNAIAAGLSSFEGTKHHQSMDLARHPKKSKPTQKKMWAKERPLANDFVSDKEFDRLLDAWFGNIARVLARGRAFYIWGGYANCANYPPVLKTHGLYFSQAVKKVNPQSMIHLTEKPVELAVWAIQYSSRTGENVLDLFGGSGSTLIGCEQTGRKACLETGFEQCVGRRQVLCEQRAVDESEIEALHHPAIMVSSCSW